MYVSQYDILATLYLNICLYKCVYIYIYIYIHSLPELLRTMSIPLWLQWTHLLIATSSRIIHRHKAQIISDWFLEHDNDFTLLKWPPQSPDLNPIEHIWDVVEREIHIMDVQLTNLQKLRDAIMSIWTKISWGMLPTPCWIYATKN